uniref:Uncharacterized protein n=1 Tax=Physcomitrium patens TaxID=3218 RepID=A0A2K1K432_PHYPA|nr:hypothetical protein PHYPA_013005 [Physcomitrium patens]
MINEDNHIASITTRKRHHTNPQIYSQSSPLTHQHSEPPYLINPWSFTSRSHDHFTDTGQTKKPREKNP